MPSTSESISCAAGRADQLGERERGRSDRPRRMDDRLQVRVVEVERVRRDAVDQCRARNVDALGTAKHGRLRGGLQRPHRSQSRVRRFMLRRADRAADPVEQRAMRLFVDRIAPAARRMLGNEARQNLRDRRRIVVGGNLRVTRHR